MECNLPAPAVGLVWGEPSILMPTFVQKLVRTVGQIAPNQRGDRINHLPQFGFRPLDLLERTSKSFLHGRFKWGRHVRRLCRATPSSSPGAGEVQMETAWEGPR